MPDKPYKNRHLPGVEGVTYPPTHWKCECGRRYIGELRLYAHQGPGRRGHDYAFGFMGGAARNAREQERRSSETES